ncbi:copper oxidase [Jeotgalibacillus soli]|uniref:Copper oxidase n=1 Tax=Jeotgalibacillus soli TaxID=889306 RepID=A0A0C2VK38_9BACL|nr:copper oxidase [Jeotgalibacillus soli]
MFLKKFVDELPIPPVIKPNGKREGLPFYNVTMEQMKQKMHRDLPPTTVWGYNGMYPGPAFEAKQNEPNPNCQRPATLCYHDHALGITRLNVYAGLAGFYILRIIKAKKSFKQTTPAPFTNGEAPSKDLSQIMQFRVKS